MNKIVTLLLLSVIHSQILPAQNRYQNFNKEKTTVQGDWLTEQVNAKAALYQTPEGYLVFSNGLVSRTFTLQPNVASIDMEEMTQHISYLRSIRPEAVVSIDGYHFDVGGLEGQRIHNYLLKEWIPDLKADLGSFKMTAYRIEEIKERFPWKKRLDWMPKDMPWPAPGKELIFTYRLDETTSQLAYLKQVEVNVHYELYDNLPVFCKWITVNNQSDRNITINSFKSEILAVPEPESSVDLREHWLYPNITIDTDYNFGGMSEEYIYSSSVEWKKDPLYSTQVNYERTTPCLLEIAPKTGPGQTVNPEKTFSSFRTWELLNDSWDRERKSLAYRRMMRSIAPWITENPILMHVRNSDNASVKKAIDQCAEVGFEMVIMTFGSGFEAEDNSPANIVRMKELADYAHLKKITLGGYSLLASRSISAANDVALPEGQHPRFGNSPCIESEWGQEYFRKLYNLFEKTGLDVFEHDGSYPGDLCYSTSHPGHKGVEDSQWNQFKRITNFYKWCRSRGIYLNVPDLYYLNGSNKTGMGYREANWSLPRTQQEIIERQNIFDGTWLKTPSMGWMFVPLVEYQGGGEAATIEPLKDHLPHYGQRLANLFGAGVQACYRGPQLYDTLQTKELVMKWVNFYKKHREVLDGDIIHIRRPDGRDYDAILHVNPDGIEKGLLMIYNPLDEPIKRKLKVNLYYTGLKTSAKISKEEGKAWKISINSDYDAIFDVEIPAKSQTWFVITNAQEHVSWLPSATNKTNTFVEINNLLRPLDGNLRLLGCRYDEARLSEWNIIGKNGLKTSTGQWECNVKANPVNGEKDALDLYLTFKHTGGDIASSGVAAAFDFSSWNAGNYVLIPASVYNGNRNRIVNRGYATGFDPEDYYRKDLPLTTVPLPQLSPNPDSLSRLEINTSYAATPAICFYDKAKKRGFILLTEQGMEKNGKIIDHGLIVEESKDRKTATMVISAPGVPEKKPEFIGFSESPYRGVEWKQGDELKLRIRIYSFETASIPGLLDKFMTVRKTVTRENTPRNRIPFSEVFRMMTANIDKRYHHSEAAEYYCPENATWIAFGWIGGLMNTYPMLAMDDEEHRKRVFSTFDFAISRAQAESGYFYGTLGDDGKVFGRNSAEGKPYIVMTRQNGDILFWMIKQFTLLKKQGYPVNPVWEENIRRQADAFVNTWKENGHLGNFLDIRTGEIAVYNTTAGAMAIGGLTLASEYYRNPEYLEIAKKAALYYFNEQFVKLGMTTGGCGDILQNSDSETAVAFMTSLMALYELTGDKNWLDKSRDLANLCATWTTSFDYQLPSNTALAKLGAKLTGAVWASTQNKHGAPGFCCSSGDPLFKIYRATGDERYAGLMHDIVHAHAEGIQPDGHITERLTYCDADSRGSRGDGGKTGWNETNGAMMVMELPGIYLRTDIDRMYVFDHVTAKVINRDKSGVSLQITNPTDFDASVSILAENKKQAAKSLGYTAFLNWPKIIVKSNETITCYIKE